MSGKVPMTGVVKDMIIPWFFQGLNADKKTGTAVFDNDEAIKKVYFSAGDIISASSNQSEDRLSEWLVRTNAITRQQGDATSELYKTTGKREGTILVEQGFLTEQGLIDGIKSQIREIIVSIFNWRDGTYAFDENPLPIGDFIPLHMSTGNLIIQGLRGLEWKVIRKSLPPLRTIIRPSGDPTRLFQGADLEKDQWAVFALIDGVRSIEDICGLSGIGDFNTLKAIYVLLALRMAETGELKTKEEKEFIREVVHETVPTKEEKRIEREFSRTITKEEIQAAHDSMASQNYYEMLGVARGATAPEIKKAYFTLAKLYHPDRHFKPELDGMKATLETLFGKIHDAYETLNDQGKRDQYDLALAQGQTKSHAEEQAKQSAAASKENAEEQYQEGLRKLKAGNFWGAEEAFHWAAQLDPKNAEYVFRRGQALSRIPRRGREAEDLFIEAVKMAPKRVEFHVELGNFYEKNSLKTKALASYQEALKLDPNSAKIKEAIRKVSK